MRVIAGKWKPLILYFLAQGGPTRYGELRRAIRDVSDKMLIQQLKELEADGLVKRTDYKEVPPRVDYSLTPLGHSLAEALVPLCSWGTEHMAEVSKVFAERDGWSTKGR
ncbi:winged helix-turn-helix transcriptional regulator [Bradyrhizobium genosp. A]|uniref:winged helix-turn-helix transcriptional regulator n=1 Tax=Bradyrhizobium genosp. A TaxID=83626 RepID=UPI003CFA6CA8